MSRQGAKTALLGASAVVVTLLGIYLAYQQRHPSGTAVRSGEPPTPGPAGSPEAEPEAGGPRRPRIGALRKQVHGVTGDLAHVQERVLGQGEQIVARFKMGKAGRRLPAVGWGPEAQEPTMPSPPQGPT